MPAMPRAPSDPRGNDRKLTISLPAVVLRQLRSRMAHDETTMRALILEALRSAGYEIPRAEIRDRRRKPDDAAASGERAA